MRPGLSRGLLGPKAIFYHPETLMQARAGPDLKHPLARPGSENRVQARFFFLIPVTLKAKYLLALAAMLSVAGIIFPMGHVAHLAHLGGLVGGLWCVNWLKIETLLQIGEEDPPTDDSKPHVRA